MYITYLYYLIFITVYCIGNIRIYEKKFKYAYIYIILYNKSKFDILPVINTLFIFITIFNPNNLNMYYINNSS